MIEAPNRVRRRGLVRRRIAKETRLGSQLEVLRADRPVNFEGAARGVPVNRSALKVTEATLVLRIVADRLIRSRISEETALPSHRRPLCPDQTMDFVSARVRVVVN